MNEELAKLIKELEKLHIKVGNDVLGYNCEHCYPYYEPTWPCSTMKIVDKYKDSE